MKFAGVIVLVVLVAAVVISGCVQEPTGPPSTGRLTQAQAEQQAFQTLEQEMDEAIEGITLEDLENELLQEG